MFYFCFSCCTVKEANAKQDDADNKLFYSDVLKMMTYKPSFQLNSLEFNSITKDPKYIVRYKYNDSFEIAQLYLYSLDIGIIDDDTLFLRNVQYLWLNNNCIKELPKSFEELVCLKSLWLSFNQIETLENIPCNVANLYADNNMIKVVDIGTWCCELETLDLHANIILNIRVSGGIGGVCRGGTKLKELHLHENKITEIPSALCHVLTLRVLSLHSNNIKALPDDFGCLSELEWLSLHFNHLETVPESFGRLSKLSKLSLHNNRFEILPDCLGGLIKLEVVSLFRNRLMVVSGEVIKCWKQCNKLAIHQNVLREIPSEIALMESLEELWLFDNYIDELPCCLNNMKNLKKIYVTKEEAIKFKNINRTILVS